MATPTAAALPLPVAFIAVIGFHHTRGPEFEFVHPAVENNQPLVNFLENTLPFLALPDNAHAGGGDVIFRVIPDEDMGGLCTRMMGISCYQHLRTSNLNAGHGEKDVSRSAVQKAVVVITETPFLGSLLERLAPLSAAYCQQGDFTNKSILLEFFDSANASLKVGLLQPHARARAHARAWPLAARVRLTDRGSGHL
jgi:hypothetical protein